MAPERHPPDWRSPREPEPFGSTANRASYVAREATENALGALAAAVRGAEPVTLLSGPPGIGKTLLFHILAHRLESEFRALFLPYAALTPEEFCTVVLDRLGAPRTDDSSGMFLGYARHLKETDSALVLLVDDAGAVPEETLRWCRETARESDGSIRCVFALTDDMRSTEVGESLGDGAVRVRLSHPMTPAETADYVQLQLAVGGASAAVRALFDESVLDELQHASGGVPRSLHTAAQALLRRPPGTVDDAHAAAEEENAQPVEEDAEAADPTAPLPGAGTVIAPAIREEIERLRQEAVREPIPEPVSEPVAPRRNALMPAAFGGAVLIGLVIASVYKPVSSWLLPESPRVESHTAAPDEAEPATEPGAGPTGPDPVVAEAAVPEPAVADPAEDAAARVPVADPPVQVGVNINASPWASIEVDGEPLGETPLAGVSLTAGPHRFRATLPDGRVIEREVVVDPDHPFVVFGDASAP